MCRLQYKVEYQRFPLWDVERLNQNRDSICEESPNTWHEEHEKAGDDPGGLCGGAIAKLGDNEQGGCVAGDRGLEYYSRQVERGQELESLNVGRQVQRHQEQVNLNVGRQVLATW